MRRHGVEARVCTAPVPLEERGLRGVGRRLGRLRGRLLAAHHAAKLLKVDHADGEYRLRLRVPVDPARIPLEGLWDEAPGHNL